MTSQKDHHDKYISALSRISGQGGEPSIVDFDCCVDTLRAIADNFPPAKAKLAVLTAIGCGAGTQEDANKLFLEAAMTGFPPSIRDLGILVLMAGNEDGMGAGLLCRAASAGDWIAGFLILREACRGKYYLSATNLKGLAGQLTDAVPFKTEIQSEISSLENELVVLGQSGFNQEKCQQALGDWKKPTNDRSVLNPQNPAIASYENILSPLECDYLIATACGSMQASKVVSADEGDSISAGYRTSDGTVLLPHMLDYPVIRILEKLSAVARIDPRNGEFLSLLRYRPGQEYFPHHDYLVEDKNDYSMVKTCGQRCATLLTYLNDGYDGGATAFPNLDISYKGQVGDSLCFKNTESSGKPIEDSLHAGLPVQSGEKWLATLWVREKPFWPWAREG